MASNTATGSVVENTRVAGGRVRIGVSELKHTTLALKPAIELRIGQRIEQADHTYRY